MDRRIVCLLAILCMLRITVVLAVISLVSEAATVNARDVPRPCGVFTVIATDTTLDISDQASLKLYHPIVDGGPQYPTELRNQHIEGQVRVSFVLDTLGHVIRNSAQITDESDPAFGRSVCEFLTRAKFVPISVSGRLLTASIVNAPFKFTIGTR